MKMIRESLATFGREVHRRREALGVTLERLAERAGLTPNYIGTIENNRRDPSLSTIVALAQALGCTPGELLGGVSGLSAAALHAARLFDLLPGEIQRALIAFMSAASKKSRG